MQVRKTEEALSSADALLLSVEWKENQWRRQDSNETLKLVLSRMLGQFVILQIPSDDSIASILEELKNCNHIHYLLCPPTLNGLGYAVSKKNRQVAARISREADFHRSLSLADGFEWAWISAESMLSKDIVSALAKKGLKVLYLPTESCSDLMLSKLSSQNIYVDAIYCENTYETCQEYYACFQKECGVLCYHQGWTDIINSSAMLSYFGRFYKRLIVIVREDTLELYTLLKPRNCILDFVKGPPATWYDFLPLAIDKIREDERNHCLGIDNYHLIGASDSYRLDQFKGVFRSQTSDAFWESFYTAYAIPYSVRLNFFEFVRDIPAEDKLYAKIVKSESYNVIHLTERNDLRIPNEEERRIHTIECYELNQLTPHFFDALKILQHAKGIYLIDSLWAAICYHLDAKYRVFSHIPITVYCLRNYSGMFTAPVTLDNWSIKI